MSATFDHNNAAAHSRPEEVASDVLVDVLLEEVINNYDLGGPFVRRLKAYRTSSGEIVVREEKIQIEIGTKLEMGLFAGCTFYSIGSRVFKVRGTIRTNYLEVSRHAITTGADGSTNHNVGTNQTTNVGTKATGTNFDSNGITYIFNVEGRSIGVSEDGSIVSKPPSTMSSGGATPNVISGMGVDQVNRDAQRAREDGLRAAARNASRNISTSSFSTIHSGSGNQFNHSGSGDQFNHCDSYSGNQFNSYGPGDQFNHCGTGNQNIYDGSGVQIITRNGTIFEF